MAPKSTRRRSPGEGGAYPYKTADGVRYRVKGLVRQPDGTLKEINRRRGFNGETWETKQAALAWLSDQQAAGRQGSYVEPSRLALSAVAVGASISSWRRTKSS